MSFVHVQARINTALNSYASANATQKAALGIEKLQFTRANGTTIDTIYETNDIISFTHTSNAYAAAGTESNPPDDTANKFLVYSYFDNKPNSVSMTENNKLPQPLPMFRRYSRYKSRWKQNHVFYN